MDRCAYRCETKDGKKTQVCMPNGGLCDIENKTEVRTLDGTAYQVIKCKFPECI